MSSQSLEDWFTRAAEIAKKVPKNLQEAAFNRALDHLMGAGAPAYERRAPGSGSERRRGAKSERASADQSATLVGKIDRTRHPDVGATARLADRAMKVLEFARRDYSVDGMTAGEIAGVLTQTFRLPAKRNAVTMALAREQTTVNLRRDGARTVFYLMQPGEDYLKQLRGTLGVNPVSGVKRSSRTSRGRETLDSRVHAPPAPKKAALAPKTEAAADAKTRGPTSRLGPKAAVEKLIGRGFFEAPRSISAVRGELKHSFGYEFVLQELSSALVRLLRGGDLRRDRNAKNQYEYHV